ncbi:nitrate reductase [Flavihumibacter sp. UBA7668]|uniref:nitrate reductase n=1 Tax=Flavihumibacter sp. UBA7668 TaxID=1946542 RepID=UPI0025B7A7D5|nr:nitrate reductase [Flavihumibacter sp. UBA7668]
MKRKETTNGYRTTCCYCGVGCGILVKKDTNGLLQVDGDPDHPVNRGQLCSKGMNLHHTVNNREDRLLFPQMRWSRNHPLERVSWDTAMERTAKVFRTLIQKYGPDAVAFYASGQCLTEEYYLINKLVKGYIGTNNIDTNSRLCMSSAVAGYKKTLGEDTVPVCYDDIELAETILVAGANPAWCHPILWRRVEAAKAANPSMKIIVTDPRKTQSAQLADLHLPIYPGTDITLHHALGRILIEGGYLNMHFIEAHCEGFQEYKEQVFSKTVEEAAAICGLELADIYLAANWIGESNAFLSMWTMGLNQSVVGVNKNVSLINLHLITGQIGKPGAGPLSLTGQPNAMGGREVGGLSNMLPAHRNLQDPAHRAEVEQFWKIEPGKIAAQPGLTATELFDALDEGKLKAVWIICTNPLVSLPNVRKAEAALKKAKFVVVQEITSKAETLGYADVVFPAAAWTEKEGSMTNAERRITHLPKIMEAPGEALPDAEIIQRFANAMSYPGFAFKSPANIFDEHAALTAGTNMDMSGVTYSLLQQYRSVQWPFKKGDSTDQLTQTAKRLFEDGNFFTPSGKARIQSVPDANKSISLTPEFPLILTTGRLRDQWHTMSKTGKVNKLKQHIPVPVLSMHPFDAAERKLNDQQMVVVDSEFGSVRVLLQLDNTIKKGVVFLPMHWGKTNGMDLLRANNLTNDLVDPESKEPDFKFTPVQVEAYRPARRKILVAGAGAGACGFLRSYRQLNETDKIELFSKEDLPFYNRVLLPDYLSGHLPWQQLIKLSDKEVFELDATLHKGVSIEKVNRQEKTVVDSNGLVHSYDVLLLATGSRAALLRDVPDLEGIYTMRTKKDADAFQQELNGKKGPVVIVGGGLLGIELAVALREMDREVIMIQRISRLMDRQLDPLGSQFLHDTLIEKGVTIYYNDEIDRYLGSSELDGIRLKSGILISSKLMVIAIGTVPNIELARESGLAIQRGVVVDNYLQTSDPSIFAIGEIAEWQQQLFGITAAAEQQAGVVANFLAGDIARSYQGSLLMNILKIPGANFCSMGMVECPGEPGYEEILFLDKSRRYYKKCIVYKDRLVGALLIGDKTEFLEFKNLIEQGTELSEKRLQLLRAGKTAEPVLGKLVCSCNNVGSGNIQQKIREGCTDLVQLCQLSGAGMGCGSCRPEVKQLLEEQLQRKSISSTDKILL